MKVDGMEAILCALQDVFRNVLGNPGVELHPDMKTGELDGWDSFANVEILLACEARWDVRFSAVEIDRVRSVGDLARAIGAKLG